MSRVFQAKKPVDQFWVLHLELRLCGKRENTHSVSFHLEYF